MSALILLALFDAEAGTRVVHGATPPKVDAVARVMGIPEADVSLAAIERVGAVTEPKLGGSGQLTPCNGAATTNFQVQEAIAAAEGAFGYLEYDTVLKQLDTAQIALRCLSEPVTPGVPARIWFVRGILRHELKDTNGAKDAFTEAFSLQPDLLWDNGYAPAARSTFDAAQAVAQGRKATSFQVFGKDVRVDGRSVAGRIDLPAGTHVLQIGAGPVATYELRVASGGATTLVLPGGVGPAVVDQAATEQGRVALAGVLDAVDAGDVVHVAIGAELWSVAVPSGSWTLMGALGPAPKAPGAGGGFKPGIAVAGAGVAVAAGGGALWAIGLGQGREAMAAGEGAAEPEYSAALADYKGAKTLVMLGIVGTAVGAGALGGGVAMLSDVSVVPAAWRGGGGLVISGRLP